MGNRLTLPLLLLAALLAGGAFFWMSHDTQGGRGAHLPVSSREPTAGGTSSAELVDGGASHEVAPSVAPARVELPVEPLSATRPSAVAAPERAGVLLRGKVVDEAGAGIAGARVTMARGDGLAFDLEGDQDFPWLRRQRTVTDAQGVFEFEGVRPGTQQVAVRAAGFAPFDRQGLSVASDKLVTLEPFVLARGAVLSGVVVDPAGRGVAGARILRGAEPGDPGRVFGGPGESLAETAADGTFRVDVLTCGDWHLVVRSEEHPDLEVEGRAETPGVEVSGLRWQLAPGAVITGKVLGIPEAERGRLEVRAAREGAGLFAFLLAARTAPVQPDGSFRLAGLDVGQSYQLRARLSESSQEGDFWERSRSESVTARAGDGNVALQYLPEGALVFRVQDALTGLPIEGLSVEAGLDWPQPLRDEAGRERKSFPGGLVRVGALRPGNPDQRVRLVVKATGYGDYRREDIAVRAGQELDLGVVLLQPIPVLRVQVLDDERGLPLADAYVRIQKQAPPGDKRTLRRSVSLGDEGIEDAIEFGEGRSARSDEQGWAEINSYEGQTVELTVRAEGFAPARVRGLFLPVGERVEQQVRMTPGGEVLVRVLDADGLPAAGARVAHRAPGEEGMVLPGPLGGAGASVTDSRGEVLFENLDPGLHAFRLDEGESGGGFVTTGDVSLAFAGLKDDSGEDWSDVQVVERERSEVTLRAAARGSLEGRVREAGELLAGATLRLTPESEDEEDAGPGQLHLPGMSSGTEVRSDGEGRYRFEDVKVGRYTLAIEHSTRQMPESFRLEVRAGENRLDADLSLTIIEGRLLSREGEPLVGLRVRAERKSQTEGARPRMMFMITDDGGGGGGLIGGPGSLRAEQSDAEGRYTLRGVARTEPRPASASCARPSTARPTRRPSPRWPSSSRARPG